jgi:hypothetical protein
MKHTIFLFLLLCSLSNCTKKEISKNIEGTWQMVYAETIENDTIKLKDLSNTTFIKIITKSHFAFFNQENTSNTNFYGGAGTYTLDNNNYTETLNFTAVEAIKKHQFSFKIEIKGDTLIQYGIEKVEAAGINRQIVEKYIKLN